MLSVILFSLMVWWILWAYTKIQSANIKMANTQEAIQAAESFLERLNDTSIWYLIDTWAYSESENINNGWNWKIIHSWALHLIDKKTWQPVVYYLSNKWGTETLKECPKWLKCTIKKDGVDLINSENVSINYLNFEIYPDWQYVNINIAAKTMQWENIYKSWITLSTTVWYKIYEIYKSEFSPEKICEETCDVMQMQSNAWNHAWSNQSNHNLFINNLSMSSCTLWYKTVMTTIYILGLFPVPIPTQATVNVFDMAKWCANWHPSSLLEWFSCEYNCPLNNSNTNPFSCSYIRNLIQNNQYTGTTCTGYDNYAWTNACTDICLATIYTCDVADEQEVIRKTGIKIKTGKYEWLYLQNPATSTTWIKDNLWACMDWQTLVINWPSDQISCQWNLLWFLYKMICNPWLRSSNLSDYWWINFNQYYNGCPANRTKNVKYYTDQPQFSEDESCVCQVSYWYSIFASGWIVEAWDCAWWSEETINNSNTQYSYEPKIITYIWSDWQTGKRRGIKSQTDTSFYWLYKDANANYNCSCTNSLEYQACLTSGCCADPFEEKKAYEVYHTESACTKSITDDIKKAYCEGDLWWKRDSSSSKCYQNSINLQTTYCENTLHWTIQQWTENCITQSQNITNIFCPDWYVNWDNCYPNTSKETLPEMKNSCTSNSCNNGSCWIYNWNFYYKNPRKPTLSICFWQKIWSCCYDNDEDSPSEYCLNKRNWKNYANDTCYKTAPYTKQTYCENTLHWTRQNWQCYWWKENLKEYCEDPDKLNGQWNTSEKTCYTNNTLPINTQWALKYYCDQHSNEWTRYNDWCRQNTDDCMKTFCYKQLWENNSCPDEGIYSEKIKKWASTYWCKLINYETCLLWRAKNIYKDYDYTCDWSIIWQSSIISNIIDNIWNVSRTNTRKCRSRRLSIFFC